MSRHLVCVCSALMLIAPVQARAQDVAGATGSVRTGEAPAPPQQPAGPRRVGIALGGGSARGFAHVGVLRWLEEHRVPVDVVAGTSMGGLIAGLFAMGMSPVEIEGVLSEIDWSSMFGASDFEFRNVRRKRDARDFPFQIEFGLTPRLTLPPSLNNGQRVDLLISRLAAPYYALSSFDDLPTPLRLVTVDLIKAEPVAVSTGSLARAMRATMSLPGIFPPVEADGRVFVDGAVLDNIPTGVVKNLGVARTIAVNVGDLEDLKSVNYTVLGMMSGAVGTMMRANSVKSMAAADVAINVPLKDYSSLAWRQFTDLIREGYDETERMRDQLLPFAVDQATYDQWAAARAARRLKTVPLPSQLTVTGAAKTDEAVMRRLMQPSLGPTFKIATLDAQITELGGLDRYERLAWRFEPAGQDTVLHIDALPKKYGPPFLFFGASLENTTGNEFRFSLAGRYLSYDVLGSGTEARLDAAIGSDPGLGVAWYRPIGSSRVFIEPNAGVEAQTLSFIQDDRTVATYRQTRSSLGTDIGVNVGRLEDIRLGLDWSRLGASVRIGDPDLPTLKGQQNVATLRWTHDGQDSPVVASRGIFGSAAVRYFLDAPEVTGGEGALVTSKEVAQMDVHGQWMYSFGSSRQSRLFITGGTGHSFNGDPLPTEQFALGGPFRLGAFGIGEQRGAHYLLATGGYLRRIGRMPDFLGGPIYVGAWMENGKAFNEWSDVKFAVHGSAGLIVETLLGPVFLSTSVGGSDFRTYFGIGRIFR